MIKQPVSPFVQNFANVDDVIKAYNAPASALEGATIHLAWYGYGDYCGSSLVVFEKDGKLWEVNGSHCSCYGLEEDGWSPEETSWKALNIQKIYSDCEGETTAQTILKTVVEAHLGKIN